MLWTSLLELDQLILPAIRRKRHFGYRAIAWLSFRGNHFVTVT